MLSAYYSWPQKLRCLAADLLSHPVFGCSYLLLAILRLNLSLFHFTGVSGCQFKIKLDPPDICLLCFGVFSSRTIAPSSLTSSLPMGCIHILRGKLNPIFQALSENKVLKHNTLFLTTSIESHAVLPNLPFQLPTCLFFLAWHNAKLMMTVHLKYSPSPLSEYVPSTCTNLYFSILFSHKDVRPCISAFHGFCSLFLSLQHPGDTKIHFVFKKKSIHAFSGSIHSVWQGFLLNISRRYTWLLKPWYQSSAKT